MVTSDDFGQKQENGHISLKKGDMGLKIRFFESPFFRTFLKILVDFSMVGSAKDFWSKIWSVTRERMGRQIGPILITMKRSRAAVASHDHQNGFTQNVNFWPLHRRELPIWPKILCFQAHISFLDTFFWHFKFLGFSGENIFSTKKIIFLTSKIEKIMMSKNVFRGSKNALFSRYGRFKYTASPECRLKMATIRMKRTSNDKANPGLRSPKAPS